MTLLRVERLSVILGRRPVLSGIDLDLPSGRLTVVIGPNGAGKTTLLRALAGLEPLQEGVVTLDGTALSRLAPGRRARSIAYLPQSGRSAWPLPVRDVVALGRLPHGERPGALPERGEEAVSRAIASLSLEGFEARPVTELSGGERARALLARALATQAPVLLADEPVAALDPRHQLIVLEVLRRHAAAGALVVAVMHDLALAARFADEIVLLDRGRIAATGRPAEVITQARLASAFGISATVTVADGEILVTRQSPLQREGEAP
jgi:iron complex transport system ATP-binding protein